MNILRTFVNSLVINLNKSKMKQIINAIKQGNVLNISLNGKLHKKNCGSVNEANELFGIALAAKSNPSDENIKALKSYLNERLRIAYLTGLETDVESNEIFMAGFNTPLPKTLIEIIEDYHKNKFPLEPIFNFWKLLMINPDTRVRESLFKFITTHDFVLTDKGYMVTYKAVYLKDTEKPKTSGLDAFVGEQYLVVKKWRTGPKKYVVYKNLEDGGLNITKQTTAEKWDEKEKNVEIIGNLADIYNAVVNTKSDNDNADKTIYTDMHSKTMSIELGVPVVMDRKDCDADPARDCSYGLHVGATKYVEKFVEYKKNESAILVCLVNPANVVAVPNYDHSKMRVTEYFPIGLAKYENQKIDIIEQKYFEDDYSNYEVNELESLIKKVIANEKPIAKAKNSEEEKRPLSELKKIIESRLIDIS
jgi:hypothetical protein